MASVTRKWTCPVESSAASLWHEGAAGSADRGGVLAARWPTAARPGAVVTAPGRPAGRCGSQRNTTTAVARPLRPRLPRPGRTRPARRARRTSLGGCGRAARRPAPWPPRRSRPRSRRRRSGQQLGLVADLGQEQRPSAGQPAHGGVGHELLPHEPAARAGPAGRDQPGPRGPRDPMADGIDPARLRRRG